MREAKDYATEKNIYIGTVLNHIPYNKLHPRIYADISSHMDDMYEDLQNDYSDENELTKKIIDEMGDPNELGKELQKIHKPALLRAKINKTIISVLFFLLCPFMVIYVCDGIADYFNSYSVKEAEEHFIEYYDEGEVNLLYEFEHDGVVHIFLVPEAQDEQFEIYHLSSAKIFGFNSKSRFDISYHSYLVTESYVIADLTPQTVALDDAVFIFFDNPKEKYIKVRFIPTDVENEEYWSDFTALPENATKTSPINMFFECPDGYRWEEFEGFDSEKNSISYYNFYSN